MTLGAWKSFLVRTDDWGKRCIQVLVYEGSESGGSVAACTSVAHFLAMHASHILAVCSPSFRILFLFKVDKARSPEVCKSTNDLS